MIQAKTREVYFSPLARKHFLTKRAAFHAEARAMMEAKYPSEPFEADTGAGWYWKNDDRLRKVHDRLLRRLRRQRVILDEAR